jgi:hypothetical protein
MTTFAPASLSFRAIAAPIPDEAPVMTATFPSICDIGGFLNWLSGFRSREP